MRVQFDAECAVLGSLLLQSDLMDECYLNPEEFNADEKHPVIMEYLWITYGDKNTCDILLVADQAGKEITQLGGLSYLMKLRDSVPTTSNFGHYQSIIREAYIQRRTTETMQKMAVTGKAEGINAKEYLGKAQAALEEISELAVTKKDNGLRKMSDVLKDHDQTIAERKQKKGVTGSKTVSVELDKMTGGHQNGDLEIVGARPSMGKTAYMGNDSIKTARDGSAVAVFSLEMSAEKIVERYLCILGNIDSTKLRTGNFDDEDWFRWSQAMDELDKLPLFIDDTPGMTLQDIRRKVKELSKKYLRLVVYIDYLQLVQPGRKFSTKNEGVEYVSKGLKLIARSFNCPVVALAQLSRGLEQRQDKRPMMSDLKDSGSIEQDADVIVFLYRDDYYNKESDKKHIIELIVAKGRNVGTGTIEMVFDKKMGKFLEFNRSQDSNGKKGET